MSSRGKVHRFVTLAIGVFGAVGQAYLLHHELQDTLPYTVMGDDVFPWIATVGVIVAPMTGILIAALLSIRSAWFGTLVPVLFCSIVFALIFKVIYLRRGLDAMAESAHADFTYSKCAEQFYSYAFSLSGVGVIIALLSSILLAFIFKEILRT